MTRTIKAHELGDEHIGAKIRTTMFGWTVEGELAEVQEGISGDYLYLLAAGNDVTTMVLRDADVAILEEAPIRALSEGVHPDDAEPGTTKLYAVMVITDWPEDDEHLRERLIWDNEGIRWRWEIRRGDRHGEHWRCLNAGYSEPYAGPWRVLRKENW